MDHTDLLTDKPVFSIELISALTKRKESLTAKYIYSAILKFLTNSRLKTGNMKNDRNMSH